MEPRTFDLADAYVETVDSRSTTMAAASRSRFPTSRCRSGTSRRAHPSARRCGRRPARAGSAGGHRARLLERRRVARDRHGRRCPLLVDTAHATVSSVLTLSRRPCQQHRVLARRRHGRSSAFRRANTAVQPRLGERTGRRARGKRVGGQRRELQPDGSLLATAGLDRTGALWSLDGRRSIAVPLTGQQGSPRSRTADGKLLTAAADGSVALRDGSSGRILRTFRLAGEALTVSFDPTGPRIAAGGTGSWSVLGASIRTRPARASTWATPGCTRSPSGPTGGCSRSVGHSKGEFESAFGPGTGLVRLVDLDTGRDAGAPISYFDPPISLAWSPDGRRLAVATANNVLHVHDARTRRAVAPDIENADAGDGRFVQSRRRRVIGATASGVTRQWDASTGREIQPALVGPTGPVAGVAYSSDGRMLATTTLGLSTTRLWEMPAGQSIGGDLVGGHVPYTTRTISIPHFARPGCLRTRRDPPRDRRRRRLAALWDTPSRGMVARRVLCRRA